MNNDDRDKLERENLEICKILGKILKIIET